MLVSGKVYPNLWVNTPTHHRHSRSLESWSTSPLLTQNSWKPGALKAMIQRNMLQSGSGPVLHWVSRRRSQCDRGELELPDSEAQLARGDIQNYVSVTSDAINAKIELERYMKEGYTKVVSKQEVMENMRHGTISRLGLIVKERPEGVKRRIIIDLRRSGGNSKATLPEKLVLPRPRDAVESIWNIYSHPMGFLIRSHGFFGNYFQ